MFNKYEERGGFFWQAISVLFVLMALYKVKYGDGLTEIEHLEYGIAIVMSIVMSKLDRISNGLHDRDR